MKRMASYGLGIALVAFSSTAFAEYYVVYSAPPQTVYMAPTTVVAAPCRVPCRVVHPCKKRHYYHHAKSSCYRAPTYSRQSCHVSVYYSMPTCNPCSSCNTTWVQGPPVVDPNFTVTYGPPIYTANTYHAYTEYSWDNRTGDDFEW